MSRTKSNFTAAVKLEIAKSAMFICAYPTCYRLTGYATKEGKARTIAEAAHINAAGTTGPRAAADGDAYTKSAENGIWLCTICHTKIDNSVDSYPEPLLAKWKKDHEEVIRRIVGKDLESALLDLRGHKRYYDETRDFISFVEDKRVLYEGLDHEFPPRVIQSLEMIRAKVAQTRAKVQPDTDLFTALNRIQQAIHAFLRDIGKDTDLDVLQCDCNNPRWRKFSDELQKLRNGIIIIIKVLSGDGNYRLTWM